MSERNQVRDLSVLAVVESRHNHGQVPSVRDLYCLICKLEVMIPPQIEWEAKKGHVYQKHLVNCKALHRCHLSLGLFKRTSWWTGPKDACPERSSILSFRWYQFSNKQTELLREGPQNSMTYLSRRWSKTWSRWGGEAMAPTESLPAALNHLPSSDSWSPLASVFY